MSLPPFRNATIYGPVKQKTPVILGAAKDLDRIAIPYEMLRCARDDGCSMNDFQETPLGRMPPS